MFKLFKFFRRKKYNKSADINAAQKIMGHVNPDITTMYIRTPKN